MSTGDDQITTYDASGNLIDIGSGFSTSMAVMNTFTFLGASMVNQTNGAKTDYTITLTMPVVPVMNGDILYMTFPTTVVLPSGAVCTPISGVTSISCTNSGQNLIAKMTTLSSSSFTGTLKFLVKSVTNPSSTKVSSAFSGVYFTDKSGFNVQQLLSTVLTTVQTTIAANILSYQPVYQDNLQMGVLATYRIQFTPTNQISPSGSIVSTWPTQVTINSTVSCQVTTNSKFSNVCTVYTANNTIIIKGAFA